MIAFFNVYVQMILNNAYAHSTEGGQIRSLKFVHIYLQCKNNIFEIHKTAISRNYGKMDGNLRNVSYIKPLEQDCQHPPMA